MGRLVLSTLHVNSARDAETRLLDLGVEKYIVDSVLRGVLAQSLEIAAEPGEPGEGRTAGKTGKRVLRYDLIRL